MNKEEVNKVLAEWMSACYHDFKQYSCHMYQCTKCGKFVGGEDKAFPPDYFPPSPDFWDLWEKAKKDPSWDMFIATPGIGLPAIFICWELIGPRFVEAWAEWVKKNENLWKK